MISNILSARDARAVEVAEMSRNADVVTVRANIPGVNKKIPHGALLVSYFSNIISRYGASNIKLRSGDDGAYSVAVTSDGCELKKRAIEIEESHKLGRFADIDVTLAGDAHSLSRGNMRKCFLCDKPAYVCGRLGTHKAEELLGYLTGETERFFLSYISDILYQSMLAELDVENKFGLVSPVSNGSHKDLDYCKMKKAAENIAPVLSECFIAGLCANDIHTLLSVLRPIGVRCEEKMYASTQGANAYKGFIFAGGVLLAASGYAIGHSSSFNSVYSITAQICRDMEETSPVDTFGYKAYREQNFGGIREHARRGFDVVKLAEERLSVDCDKTSLLTVLTTIVGKIDDSVLLKRARNVERYQYFKELISTQSVYDTSELIRLNRLCERENISIGGSADVLICAVMMRKIRERFIFSD